MEPGRTKYNFSPNLPGTLSQEHNYAVTVCIQELRLETQRNWIPKCPISIRLFSNCYASSEKLVAEIKEVLTPALDRQMPPEAYGTALNRILINCSLSYGDREYCKANYIILDDDARLSAEQLQARLRTMYSEKKIETNRYHLRKRFEFGRFNSTRNTISVEIHFSKDFSEQSITLQKREFAKQLSEAVDGTVKRLKAKKLQFDLDRMSHDFQAILRAWTQ